MPNPKLLDERLEIEAIRAAASGDAEDARAALALAEEIRTARQNHPPSEPSSEP